MTGVQLNVIDFFLQTLPDKIKHPRICPTAAKLDAEELANGVRVAHRAFRDLRDERDDADRRAGAAARKIHQLQRQLDRLRSEKGRTKKRRPWPQRVT